MARVSLDGITIEVAHGAGSADVTSLLEAFAQDLARNKFSSWGVTVQRIHERCLTLAGRREGTHFDARVEADERRALVTLAGAIELSRVKLTLAGGTQGVRRRVETEVAATLRRHLG